MATFLETLSILNFFSALFAALLVFAVVFAILNKTRILGESKVIQWIVAIALGLLTLVYPDIISLVEFISPWFVLLFIFLILLLLAYRLFGYSEENILEYVKSDRTINWVLVAVGVIILLAGIFNVFGESALQATAGGNATSEGDSGSGFQENVFSTLFSPQLLGVLLVFAIAVFAIAFLGGKPAP